MKSLVWQISLVVCLVYAASDSIAQSLAGRHQIGLQLGMWSQTTETKIEAIGGISTSVDDSGLLGGLVYNHWLDEDLALAIRVSALSLDTTTQVSIAGVSTDFAMVGTVLLGLKHSVLVSATKPAIRPFLSGSVGVFRGSQDDIVTGRELLVASREETAFGGQLGGVAVQLEDEQADGQGHQIRRVDLEDLLTPAQIVETLVGDRRGEHGVGNAVRQHRRRAQQQRQDERQILHHRSLAADIELDQ